MSATRQLVTEYLELKRQVKAGADKVSSTSDVYGEQNRRKGSKKKAAAMKAYDALFAHYLTLGVSDTFVSWFEKQVKE